MHLQFTLALDIASCGVSKRFYELQSAKGMLYHADNRRLIANHFTWLWMQLTLWLIANSGLQHLTYIENTAKYPMFENPLKAENVINDWAHGKYWLFKQYCLVMWCWWVSISALVHAGWCQSWDKQISKQIKGQISTQIFLQRVLLGDPDHSCHIIHSCVLLVLPSCTTGTRHPK